MRELLISYRCPKCGAGQSIGLSSKGFACARWICGECGSPLRWNQMRIYVGGLLTIAYIATLAGIIQLRAIESVPIDSDWSFLLLLPPLLAPVFLLYKLEIDKSKVEDSAACGTTVERQITEH